MKLLPLLLGISLSLASLALAQSDFPTEGQVYESVSIDLNGDLKPDKVGLRAYRVDDMSYWGQLHVWDSSGKVLWQAPKNNQDYGHAQGNETQLFGAWPWGISGLEAIGDLDGDGNVELVSTLPQSDVRPTTFRIFRWNGKAFTYIEPRQLFEKPLGSGKFVWGKPSNWNGNTPTSWVSSFDYKAKGWVADITVAQSGGAMKFGKAKLGLTSSGFQVDAWMEKPH